MIIYAIVMLIVLPAAAFAFGLCRAAAKPTPQVPKPQTCTRRAPHVCTVNGPCNGFPRLQFANPEWIAKSNFAEGRPTMPSEVEPELEMERRTR